MINKEISIIRGFPKTPNKKKLDTSKPPDKGQRRKERMKF